MKATTPKKALSLFLSLLMAFSVFGILTPKTTVLAAGSATDAHWNALRDALRNENVANARFNGSGTVTVEDRTGDILVAAKAYYNVLNDYIFKTTSTSGGSSGEYGYNYRTSSQVCSIIKTQMQSRMGSSDYSTYNAANVIQYLGGNATVSPDQNTTQGSVPTTTVTVKVTSVNGLMNYSSLSDVNGVPTWQYSVTHGNGRRYESGSGCNKKTYYYCTAKTVTTSTGTANYDISLLTAFQNALNNNASLLAMTQAQQIDQGYSTLSTAFNAIDTAKTNAINKFGSAIVGHFFSSRYADIDALEASMKIAQFKPIVDRINGYIAEDFSEYSRAQLTTLYENLNADYTSYLEIGIDEVYAYFENGEPPIFDKAAVEAAFAAIENAYQIAELREVVRPLIEADIETFSAYDDDWVLANDNAEALINAAKTAIAGHQETLASYKAENVVIVFGENYNINTLVPLNNEMNRLLEVNNYKVLFEGYQSVYTQAFEPVTDAYTTDQLYSVLNARDTWYTQLQAYVAELEAYDPVLAGKILTTLEAAMEDKIDSVYAMLNARVEAIINTSYDLYQGFVERYGYEINTANDICVQNYTDLRAAIGRLNPDHYNFLVDTEHFDIDPETVRKYEEIENAVFAYVNFDVSLGLSAYKYNKEYVDDITRYVNDAKDVARDKDYTTSDEDVERLIDMIEALLGTDAIKEKFDLSGTVGGVLDKLYTDEFVNTLVQYLYPLIVKEFAKVWVNIPDSVDTEASGFSVHIDLTLDSMATVLNKIGLAILPPALATKVQGNYPEAAAKLAQATQAATWDATNEVMSSDPWTSSAICDEDGKLTLVWGVTDRESFLDAAAAALSGLDPLLHALLMNKSYNKEGIHIGTGEGQAAGCVDVHVTSVKLTMKFAGNPGYNNAIAPLLSALGADNLPNGNALANTRALLADGLFGPLETVLNGIAAQPLHTILGLLPNLAFAMKMGLVQPLLNELKTSINYWADADYNYKILFNTTNDTLTDATNSKNNPIAINIGEMLDLTEMGIDISSLNGLLNSVIGLLTKSDEEAEEGEGEEEPAIVLPEIDEDKLAMLGDDVVWLPGYRTVSPYRDVSGHGADFPRIILNTYADVFLFVVDYVVSMLDQDTIDLLIAKFSAEEEPAEGDEPVEPVEPEPGEGEGEEEPSLIETILLNFKNNYTDSVAAVIELIAPQEYDMTKAGKIEWITEGNIGEGEDIYCFADGPEDIPGKSLWTREDAVYAESHLEEVVNGVIKLLSDKLGGAETLGEAANYLLKDMLFTADTANTLVGTFKDLLGGLELPDMLAEMGLFEQLGIDLTAWDEMEFDFENGDAEAFEAALVEILNPLNNLLAFILAEKDIELTIFDSVTVKALGYDGYSYGIVPLLEVLGCDVMTTEAFLADKDNVVANLVHSVFSLVDTILDDPLAFIREVVPAICYFDACGGFGVAISNLLYSVNVLLDTIRPLYNVDLENILRDNLDIDLAALSSDLVTFVMQLVVGMLEEKTGITLTLDYSVATLAETLHFTDPTPYDSANGDVAYTVALSDVGRAELFARIFDYLIEQIAAENNRELITGMIGEMIGDNEDAQAIVNEILNNLITNYTDSVMVIFKLLFPRDPKDRVDMTPVRKIDWITSGSIADDPVDPFWSTDDVEGETPWKQADAEYAESHLDDILNYVAKLLGDKIGGAEDLGGALKYLVKSLITADTANKLVETVAGLFAGIALPEELGEYISLAPLGIDASNWDGMSFEFEDGDLTAFKNALIEILAPLTPILQYLLAGKTLELPVKDALVVKSLGYDGYSYGIVPLLEALGATGVKSTEAFLADPDNVVKNIVDPLFTVVDHLLANPMNTIRTLLPSLIYFNKVDGIGVAIDNLLFSVTALITTVQPLYEVDLFGLIEEKTGYDIEAINGDFIVETLLGLASDAITENTPVTVELDLTLDELANCLLFTEPTKFTSANGDDAYTVKLTAEGRARLFAKAMDLIIGIIGTTDNMNAIKAAVHEVVTDEEAQAIVDEVLDNVVGNYTDSVLAVVKLVFPRDPEDREDMSPVKKINWITEGNIGSDEDWMGYSDLPEGAKTLWTKEKAVYMAEHLGDFLNDIVVIFGEQLGGAETVDQAVEYLVKDIFTAENANSIAKALHDFVDGLNLPEIVADLGVLEQLGLDAANWEGMTFSFADGDRTAFKNALITIIKPLTPVLAFLLAEKQLEVILKDALPIRALGYDGYSYGIVPLLEALGATGLKKTAAFKADPAHIVENIINPLFTIVDHLIANPVKFIEDVIPALLYFDKVEGVQAAVPNLLFAVEALLHIIAPLYDKIDIYELIEEKTGVDITFENEDPIDFVLDKVTEMVADSTGITLNLESAAELTEALQFEEPTKFTSANGDDAYTVRLTETGKAALLSRILDYGVNQVIFEDNFDKLSEIFKSLISDDDTRAFAIGILDIMKHADQDYRDLHGIHDVALAELFWVFFGADSVTDAVADFFYRYKDANFFEILYLISDKAPDYIQRIEFLMKEVYAVEYPAALELIENAEDYLKPPYEYNEHETAVVSGVLGRILAFFTQIINFFKNLFKK